MPRPKGSKNKPKTGVTAAAKKTNKDYEALLAEKTAEKEQLTAEIARYKDAPLPAVILIPGKTGSLGIAGAALHDAVERAVGADIS